MTQYLNGASQYFLILIFKAYKITQFKLWVRPITVSF